MKPKPRLENRSAMPFAAIRAQVPIPFGQYLQPMWSEVHDWLSSVGCKPSGAPITRYLTTDMDRLLDIEVGFPIAEVIPGGSRVSVSLIPEGRYAVYPYYGSYQGLGLVKATADLLEWAEQHGIQWKKSQVDGVEWWEARYENYLTDPDLELDPKKWLTEITFLTQTN